MDEVKLKQIMLVSDLSKSIAESVAYLFTFPEEDLARNTLQGMNVVIQQLHELFPNGVGIVSPLHVERMKQSLIKQITQEFVSEVENWQKALLESLGQRLREEIIPLLALNKEEAEEILKHLDDTDYSLTLHYQLLFDTVLKCGYSMPEEAYHLTMKMLEEVPTLLSNAFSGYTYKPTHCRKIEACPICGGEGTPYYNSLILRSPLHSDIFPPVKIWMKCQGCGDIYADQFPEEFLALSNQYIRIEPKFDMASVNETSAFLLEIWCTVLKNAVQYLKNMRKVDDILPEQENLLEVGVGEGGLLAVALELGFQVEAVEIEYERAQRFSNLLNIPIWCCDFLEYQDDKRYSIISMGDVIEHVVDPTKALLKAHSLLKDDGVLWLSTPNYESSFSKLRKFEDPMWLEAYHISYFSKSGFEKFADRCGFRVLDYKVSNRYQGSMELFLVKK